MSRTVLAAGSAIGIASFAAISAAGPLTPPAGPIGPTHKTLSEIEPRTPLSAATTPGDSDSVFKITQPGTYYLTGSVTGQVGKMGIEIALMMPGSVTIDLNGFELLGVADSLSGIDVTLFGQPRISVRNGTVRGWEENGIYLGASGGGVVENVRAVQNFGSGIVASSTVIRECLAVANAQDGIRAATGSLVTACIARGNLQNGIHAFAGCMVERCTAESNSLSGISMEQEGVVRDNQVRENTGDGIRVEFKCRVVGNQCSDNGYAAGNGAGVHVLVNDNHVEGNTVHGNDRGIDVDGIGNLVIRCSASSNSTDYDIVAGNSSGPVVTGGNLGTNTNPHANISY